MRLAHIPTLVFYAFLISAHVCSFDGSRKKHEKCEFYGFDLRSSSDGSRPITASRSPRTCRSFHTLDSKNPFLSGWILRLIQMRIASIYSRSILDRDAALSDSQSYSWTTLSVICPASTAISDNTIHFFPSDMSGPSWRRRSRPRVAEHLGKAVYFASPCHLDCHLGL